ncbi:hypothetical protein AB0870_16005 [Microbacterium proteolyticum]|uniref:hypothetical protein n=1 Tax=Microbacterium proteolyticum TaxID=1572644 RepID=UPI0024163C7B|nr:hypothetical protein [Microbacterium proteolyticum]
MTPDGKTPPLTAEEAEAVAIRFLARSTEDDGIPRVILGPAVEALDALDDVDGRIARLTGSER